MPLPHRDGHRRLPGHVVGDCHPPLPSHAATAAHPATSTAQARATSAMRRRAAQQRRHTRIHLRSPTAHIAGEGLVPHTLEAWTEGAITAHVAGEGLVPHTLEAWTEGAITAHIAGEGLVPRQVLPRLRQLPHTPAPYTRPSHAPTPPRNTLPRASCARGKRMADTRCLAHPLGKRILLRTSRMQAHSR